MIYLELILGFLKVGIFSFGGAYAAIPLIREVVMEHAWMSEEYFSHIIAIAESTPGPIMINVATYVGSDLGGILGSLVATLAVALPSFIMILLIVQILKELIKNQYFQAILKGMKPSIAGIILATGIYMLIHNTFQTSAVANDSLLTVLFLGACMFVYQKTKKKK